jgi:hypothetical protein
MLLTLSSPVDTMAHRWLSAHMVQHLFLMMVVAPLLWMGAPVAPLLVGLPRLLRKIVLAVANAPASRHLTRWLLHPSTGWVAFALAFWVWHAPALYDLALDSDRWHHTEHACFLVSALLFWRPVILAWPARVMWPRWAMIPYLALAMFQSLPLAVILTFSDRVIYTRYSSVDDQALAGRGRELEERRGNAALGGVVHCRRAAPRGEQRRGHHGESGPVVEARGLVPRACPQHPARLAGKAARDDRGSLDAGELGQDEPIADLRSGRGHQAPAFHEALHVAGHDGLVDGGGDLGMAAGDRDAELARTPIDVAEDPPHGARRRAGRDDDRGLEPRRPRPHDGDVVGIDVHRIPADVLGREGHRVALQDQVLLSEIDHRGVLAERGPQHDASIRCAAKAEELLQEPDRQLARK